MAEREQKSRLFYDVYNCLLIKYLGRQLYPKWVNFKSQEYTYLTKIPFYFINTFL